MVKAIRIIVLLGAVLAITGCARLNSIHRTHDFKEGSAIIDIKQRAIVAKMGYVHEKASEGKDTKGSEATIGGSNSREKELMICAEPSPDAMSAYAAELAGKASLPDSVAIEIAGAFHESASNVGLRTQSIQLLRDRSYRLCEARMNGFISNAQFELQMRREQRNTVALLAIEQLTGVVKAPTVTINTKGTAEIARNVDDLVAQKEQKDKEIAEKKQEKKDITGTDETAEAKKTALQKEIDELEESRNAIAESIKKDRSMVASGSATAVVHADGLPTQRSDAHIQAIADTVDKIVEYTQTDDLGQMCLIYMERENIPKSLTTICTNHLKNIVEREDAVIKIMEGAAKIIERRLADDKKMAPEEAKVLLKKAAEITDKNPGYEVKSVNQGIIQE